MWTHRSAVRLAALFLPVWVCHAAHAQGLTAAVLERPSSFVNQWSGTVRALGAAGFTTRALNLQKDATAQGADLIVFGSFCSQSADYKNYITSYGSSLASFVNAGGVVLQFTQADQTEMTVPFLPAGLFAQRGDEDLSPLFVRDPSHPLLKDITLTGGEIALSLHRGLRGDWESIERQQGFRVLISIGKDYYRKALLEGAHGQGRFLITSMFLDVLYDTIGRLVAPWEWARASSEFFRGLKRYVELVKTGQAPTVVPTPPYTQPKVLPFVPGSFTLVALPDTQLYSQTYPQHFHAQTAWIAANVKKYNIRYVLHLGDLTNTKTTTEWAVAKAALQRLDGIVPYAIALGNHDCSGSDRSTLLSTYFPPKNYETWPTFGGVMEPGKLDNSFHTFPGHGEEFLILALEVVPRDQVLTWVNRVIEDHPDHRVILITHLYLYNDNTRYDWPRYGSSQSWSMYGSYGGVPGGINDGESMFQKAVRRHPKFLMTVNGHVLGDGLAQLASECDEGNQVYQTLVNYQMKTQGGQGYLRLIEFLPDGNTVQMRTFSPVTGLYKTDSQNQYILKLKPPIAVR